jgi:adenylate kinase
MKKIIILLGVPGSGKGTQAKKIAKKNKYSHISTGDLLRTLAKDPNADPEDKKKLEEMKSGDLVSDELIYKLAFREIEKNLDSNRGVVLDGAIRSVEQAKKYQAFFISNRVENDLLVIEIHISDDTVMKRLKIRLETQGKQRVDDDPEIMKKRIEDQGNTAIKPILDYYDQLGVLKKVDGESSIDEVEKKVEEALIS